VYKIIEIEENLHYIFVKGILPHWDYMWKDRARNRCMGMLMYPEK